ncbi:hypothetical protein QL285_018615 [Trifolium repens]|nr:hypothetical protein QL285_018615 [Trifolium repens]
MLPLKRKLFHPYMCTSVGHIQRTRSLTTFVGKTFGTRRRSSFSLNYISALIPPLGHEGAMFAASFFFRVKSVVLGYDSFVCGFGSSDTTFLAVWLSV